jgi:hypothetical protein
MIFPHFKRRASSYAEDTLKELPQSQVVVTFGL